MINRSSGRSLYLALSLFAAALFTLLSIPGTSKAEKPEAGQREEPYVFSAFLTNGVRSGDLVLGRTTYDEALKIFPEPTKPYDGRFRPAVEYPVLKLGGSIPVPRYIFNPWHTMYALFFDSEKRLVIISELLPMGSMKKEDLLKKHPQLEETAVDVSSYELQGDIRPCVTVIAVVDAKGDSVEQVSYAYACAAETPRK